MYLETVEWGNPEAEHQQFAMDPHGGFFLLHPLNEITQATIDLGRPCPVYSIFSARKP
jgi:hypothetical protein